MYINIYIYIYGYIETLLREKCNQLSIGSLLGQTRVTDAMYITCALRVHQIIDESESHETRFLHHLGL